jgi:heterodisulfide reductase subunit A
VLVHCVGSKINKYAEYCSAVCCKYLLKFAHLAKEKLADVSVTELYSDFCLPGKESQSFLNKLSEEHVVEFLHMKDPDSIEIVGENDNILINYTDVHGENKTITSDMVVLAPAIEGARDARNVAKVFDVSQGKGGFFVEEHSSLDPVSTSTAGIFIVGCAQGPKDIQSSVAQGQAAAGRILSQLIPGEKLRLEAMTAIVDEDLCSGCKICIGVCPYKATTYEEHGKHITVNELLCRGCGSCTTACPSGAIKAKHFTDIQISSEMKGLLQ